LAPVSALATTLFIGLIGRNRGPIERVVVDSRALRHPLDCGDCIRDQDDFGLRIFHKFHLLPVLVWLPAERKFGVENGVPCERGNELTGFAVELLSCT
jgi:hypothetical protein